MQLQRKRILVLHVQNFCLRNKILKFLKQKFLNVEIFSQMSFHFKIVDSKISRSQMFTSLKSVSMSHHHSSRILCVNGNVSRHNWENEAAFFASDLTSSPTTSTTHVAHTTTGFVPTGRRRIAAAHQIDAGASQHCFRFLGRCRFLRL